MSIIVSLLVVFLLITGLFYFYHIGLYINGWNKTSTFGEINNFPNTIFISVIVAVRNEENNIDNLLNSLHSQTYSSDYFEIIIVNDHSTDKTVEKILQYTDKKQIKLIELTTQEGKKNAVHAGIVKAKGGLIVTTDADCTHHKNWLKCFAAFYQSKKPIMIIASVLMSGHRNKIQESCMGLEFMSLIASTAGAAGANKAVMCNAANMAFEKDKYLEFTNAMNNKMASGDDMFLLSMLKSTYGAGRIHFLKAQEAIVASPPPPSFRDFFSQRIRWASKSNSYTDKAMIRLTLTIVSFNILLLLSVIFSFFDTTLFKISIAFFIIKSIFDFILLSKASVFFQKQKWLWYFLPVQIIYPFYILTVAIAVYTFKPKWKGRDINNHEL